MLMFLLVFYCKIWQIYQNIIIHNKTDVYILTHWPLGDFNDILDE